ncbi:MAG: hypothetical protein ABFR47_02060 [Verrucomicrobiota bacterium]
MGKHINYSILTVMLLSGICIAENEDIEARNSIRVSYGRSPGVDKAETSWGETLLRGDSDARLEIWGVRQWKGKNRVEGMLGGGFFLVEHNGVFYAGDELEISAMGLLLQCGIGVDDGDISFGLGPYVGLGFGDATAGDSGGDGFYALVGVKGSVFVSLIDPVELGLEFGGEMFAFDGSFIVANRYEGSGLRVAVVLGFKF